MILERHCYYKRLAVKHFDLNIVIADFWCTVSPINLSASLANILMSLLILFTANYLHKRFRYHHSDLRIFIVCEAEKMYKTVWTSEENNIQSTVTTELSSPPTPQHHERPQSHHHHSSRRQQQQWAAQHLCASAAEWRRSHSLAHPVGASRDCRWYWYCCRWWCCCCCCYCYSS